MKRLLPAVVMVVAAFAFAADAAASDAVRVAVGQRGNWDTSVSELGQRAGIFSKHGLKLEIVHTQDASQTLQMVMTGGADIGVAVGTMGVLAASSKGAPLRVIGAQMTGASDLYWYAKADSPVASLKDIAGKSMAYSVAGSSTHGIVTALMKQHKLKAKPVATGGPPGTLTQVVSGEVDVGWAAPPFGLEALERREIRMIATGNDAAAFRERTARLLVTTQQVLDERKTVIDRYMKAYRETIDWMYSGPEAVKLYAAALDIPEARARRTRDDFFPKEALDPDKVAGLDASVRDAVALKFIAKAPSKDQLSELIRIPPR